MKKVRLVLLGAGSRSRAYTENILSLEGVELAGVVEPNAGRRNRIVQMFDLPAAMAFESEDAFFEGGRREGVDGLLICTMDRDHARQAIRACRCGYDLLLEKPAALTREDCLGILEAAAESGSRVMVCHVLRYTPFFGGIKKILDSGELGRIIAVQHNENACVFHFAHSYVRGSWRNSAVASPIILAKSCHDLDILSWLVGERCLRVSSYGGLSHFRMENAPKGSTERCCDCPVRKECLFDAEHIYLDGLWWNKGAVNLLDQSD